jgi:hypothetical protein
VTAKVWDAQYAFGRALLMKHVLFGTSRRAVVMSAKSMNISALAGRLADQLDLLPPFKTDSRKRFI